MKSSFGERIVFPATDENNNTAEDMSVLGRGETADMDLTDCVNDDIDADNGADGDHDHDDHNDGEEDVLRRRAEDVRERWKKMQEDELLICAVCLDLQRNAVETDCGHNFCGKSTHVSGYSTVNDVCIEVCMYVCVHVCPVYIVLVLYVSISVVMYRNASTRVCSLCESDDSVWKEHSCTCLP